MTVHPLDDLAAYALGALDADERRAIDAHLATCASCRAEVRSFAETAWLIAEPQSRQVPPRLRAAIVALALAVFMTLAVYGYDPARGLIARKVAE